MPSPDSSPESPDLHVTDMNDNKLAISFKSKGDETSPPSSPPTQCPDVHVVQELKTGQKLHSILKQRSRTVSESSDEVFTYSRENSVCIAGSESPISESEEGGDGEPGRRMRKKSVSFSEKVDQQTFKQNQPTTSLRNTLKNKRKNQRKAEKRHQDKVERSNRRNRSSDSISEMSSDGEVSSNHEDTDNGTGPDEMVDNQKSGSKNVNKNESVSKNGTTTSIIADANGNITTPNVNDTSSTSSTTAQNIANNQQKNKKNGRRKNRKSKKQAHTGDEVASDAHQPPETSSAGSQSEGELGASEGGHECCDSEKVPKKKLVEIVKDDGHDSDDDNGDGDDESPDTPQDVERTSDKNETILNWEDKAAGDRAIPCPVSFTNSVMFDLD